MTQDETLSPSENLTGDELSQESGNTVTEPPKDTTNNQVDLDGANNWQHALQLKQERIKALEAAQAEKDRKIRSYEESDKKKRLGEMDEVERLKLVYAEKEEEVAKLKLERVVDRATAGKEIPASVLEILKETPWVFPAIKNELRFGESTWEETVDAVTRNIDSVVESLTVKADKTLQEQPRRVDSERSAGDTVVKNRPLTRAEYDAIMASDVLYDRNKDRIDEYIASHGGVLPNE